jgi:hypothetical protein
MGLNMADKQTILISGMAAGVPYHGGATWAVLQYVLGLRDLGHTVYLVEPVTLDAGLSDAAWAVSPSAVYFARVMAEFGLQDHAALLRAGTQATLGLPYAALRRTAQQADLLLNISGMLADEALLAPIPHRVFVDLDPAFNQLWHSVDGVDMHFAAHTHFATVGLALGQPECTIPTCGRAWIPTLQPVVLEQWPLGDDLRYDGLTTVANWRSYGTAAQNGVVYGQKAHALRPLLDLPTRTGERFMPALAIHPAETQDLAALHRYGWHLLDPACVAGDPAAYRAFIRSSKAEFGFAKSGYVLSRSGWFSDRSACYLAAGRPVIAQETGFGDHLPLGEGLFAFADAGDVLAAIDAVNSDYPRQRAAARALAEEFFAAERVLTRLLTLVEN